MTSSEGLWSTAGTSPMQQSWSRCRLGERQGRQSEGTRRRWRLGEVARGPPRRNREVCCVRGGSAIFDEGVRDCLLDPPSAIREDGDAVL